MVFCAEINIAIVVPVAFEDDGSVQTNISSTQPDANAENLGNFPRYEITFNAAPAVRSNEYHQVGIRVDRPNLKVLARQGYFAQFSGDQ